MNKYNCLFTLAALALLPSSGLGQELKVGELSSLYAWVNKQPGDVQSLHVVGQIVARNACFDAITSYTGDKKSNPPILMIKVGLVEKPGVICPQVEGQERNIEFRYDDPSYAGTHEVVEVSSDTETKEVKVETAQ